VTSRAATDELLAGLRAGRWKPSAWARFMALSARRSAGQAREHPRALAQLTVLHAVFARLAGRRGHRWTAVSWMLAISHLGMLEGRPSLGLPSAVTLLRGNLPAIWPGAGRWLPAVALATDLADGRIARRLRAETPFGAQADSLADAAFWTWFVLRHEPSRPVQAAALVAWAAPVAVVTAVSFRRGRMLDAPRPVMVRPAAAMQAVVAVRALLRPRPALFSYLSRTNTDGGRDDMLRAIWNGVVLAQAPRTIRLEGNHYFPPESLNREYFTASRTKSVCPWKGLASYYTVVVDGQANPDAAWSYPHPSPLARRIKGHVAFWNGVRVEGEREPDGAGRRAGRWWRGLAGHRP
jgi:uncharacterized protein (DUF427 family)